MRHLRLALNSLQAAAAILAITAAAHTRPADKGLDRGGLGLLAESSTRYLDPETTGAIAKLIDTR